MTGLYNALKYILLLLTLALSVAAPAQQGDTLIQLSGIVADADAPEPLPFATIYAKGTTRGTVSAANGFFSLVVMPKDTIIFQTLGYKSQAYIVPDTLTRNKESIIVRMQKDTVNLPQVDVYPWPSRERFREEFLSMEIKTPDSRAHFERLGFIYLDTTYAVEPSPLWNPASFLYENVFLKIKERVPKKQRAKMLPKYE